MKLAVYGALGRMGRSILRLAASDPFIELAGAVDSQSDGPLDIGEIAGIGKTGVLLQKDISSVISYSDVVIDFSSPEASLACAAVCAENGVPLVIGTTGFSSEMRSALIERVKNIPCVFSPNMSVGVNVLFRIVRDAASILGDLYDIEISETHHRFKKDAPSGTALRLAEIAAEARGIELERDAVYGRKGMTGERKPEEIGIHVLRAGDTVGDHTVLFGAIGERLEFTHRAQSRDSFASGAIRAAKFVNKASPGIYDMQDVLGFK